MFGTRRHAARLKLSKEQGADVVLVHADVETRLVLDGQFEMLSDFLDKIHYWKKVTASGAQRHIFRLHRGKNDFLMNLPWDLLGSKTLRS